MDTIFLSLDFRAERVTFCAFTLPMNPSPSPSSHRKTIPLLRAALALLLGLPIAAASAATFTWNNTTGNWNDGTKWGGSAPSGTNATDVLVFGGDVGAVVGTAPNYTATNNVAVPRFQLNQLSLQTTDAGVTRLDNFIAGSALQLTGTAPQILENGAGFTVDAPIDLTAATEFGGTSTGTVSLNYAISGTVDIVKNGPGTFRFGTPPFLDPSLGSSANTWLGRLTINAGTFRFNNNAQSGPTALRANPVTINGAQLLFATKVSDPESSVRMGALSGTGLVQARGQTSQQGSPALPSQDSLDIGMYAFTDGDYAGTLSNTRVNNQSAGHSSGTLIVRGTAVQTLSGILDIEKDIVVGGSATLRLAGNASLNAQSAGAIVINGGTFVLDNAVTPLSTRLRDGNSASTGVDVIGGGIFSLVGNAAGTSETVARLQLGTGTKPRSGALTVSVTQNAGAAATVIDFQSYLREQAQNPCNTVNFAARTSAGAALPLGLAGNNPRIIFNTTSGAVIFNVPLFNSLLGNTGTGDSTTVGWATVNGTDFATHGAVNGIAAVTAVTPPVGTGTGDATANVVLSTGLALTNASGYSVNSIKLAPSSASQVLSLAAGNLNTAAILLAGSTDFSITSSGGGIGNAGGTGPRYFHVQQAVLTVGASLAPSINSPIVKAGDGTLVLTSAGNVGVTAPLYLNAGSVRAAPGSSLPAGELRFRGGVLEITGGGTFSRTIGFGGGKLTWAGIDGAGAAIGDERGSGGFAAIGADVTVDLNTAGATNFAWEDLGFLDSGFALILGSRNATAKVTFADNINLTQTPQLVIAPALPKALNYNAREIRVVDNPGSANDSAAIGGVISGSLQNDLLKTGDGLLELTAANTMQGMVFLAAGTLKLTGSVANSILTDVQTGATLTGTGTATQIVLESGGKLAPGNGGIGTLNATTLTWRSGGAGFFDLGAAGTADRIALGSGALVKGSASGPFTFNFNGTGVTGQVYTLATFGSTTFTAADFSATNLASGVTGVFQVSSASLIFTTQPIEVWRQFYFGASATNTGNAADTADADKDGLTNLGEYVLSGSSPLVSSTALLPVTGFSGNFPTFTFTRNLSATDVTLFIEAKLDLTAATWTTLATRPGAGPWTPSGGASVVENVGGVVTLTDSLSIPGTTKRFYRLRVTHP